jgi:hypothetical protein
MSDTLEHTQSLKANVCNKMLLCLTCVIGLICADNRHWAMHGSRVMTCDHRTAVPPQPLHGRCSENGSCGITVFGTHTFAPSGPSHTSLFSPYGA